MTKWKEQDTFLYIFYLYYQLPITLSNLLCSLQITSDTMRKFSWFPKGKDGPGLGQDNELHCLRINPGP